MAKKNGLSARAVAAVLDAMVPDLPPAVLGRRSAPPAAARAPRLPSMASPRLGPGELELLSALAPGLAVPPGELVAGLAAAVPPTAFGAIADGLAARGLVSKEFDGAGQVALRILPAGEMALRAAGPLRRPPRPSADWWG
jgi:hypothetical protein